MIYWHILYMLDSHRMWEQSRQPTSIKQQKDQAWLTSSLPLAASSSSSSSSSSAFFPLPLSLPLSLPVVSSSVSSSSSARAGVLQISNHSNFSNRQIFKSSIFQIVKSNDVGQKTTHTGVAVAWTQDRLCI